MLSMPATCATQLFQPTLHPAAMSGLQCIVQLSILSTQASCVEPTKISKQTHADPCNHSVCCCVLLRNTLVQVLPLCCTCARISADQLPYLNITCSDNPRACLSDRTYTPQGICRARWCLNSHTQQQAHDTHYSTNVLTGMSHSITRIFRKIDLVWFATARLKTTKEKNSKTSRVHKGKQCSCMVTHLALVAYPCKTSAGRKA